VVFFLDLRAPLCTLNIQCRHVFSKKELLMRIFFAATALSPFPSPRAAQRKR
jgi:hypothetical protein